MERNQINGRIPAPAAGRSSASPPLFSQPNYGSRAVQEALEHLASGELIEWCGEAKVERCRAARDLRSCGRYVHYLLDSCGHASLCSECSQRCDVCPICRTPIPKSGNRLRLRLYYECIEAGLISKRCDERFQEKEDGDEQLAVDVQRLYSLFDVAMENNLASLICHYVTDVCMDETAVSSDPVIAFLLDEVVVKDWCNRTFRRILDELQVIYSLEVGEMKTRMNALLKLSTYLGAVSHVLDVLESSFKASLSAKLQDLQHLQERILKTRQHMEIMIWCIRYQFLENVVPRYCPFMLWNKVVRERKSASIKRAWPDAVNQSAESSPQAGSLFIEDALSNIESEHLEELGDGSDLACIAKDRELFMRSKIEGLVGYYPFENLRAAADLLFLHGSSDMVVAKQAIFVYYLFDRYWTTPEAGWRYILDDFAATIGITRHSLLESFVFYLLDDHTDAALKEACELLPEISGSSTHPKIAQVLLEREVPDIALMVLRWSGRDGACITSLTEAVTSVRVRVGCGLLTEAFMHQRALCDKVKEMKRKGGPVVEAFTDPKGKCGTWEELSESLVSEICCLCIKSNLIDRMIELPWNLDEEKYIHKCLLDVAINDPSTTAGSLLVVYYLQRYRYAEAYQLHLKLQTLEKEFITKCALADEVLSRMDSASSWRAKLVLQSIELLPQVQQQQIKSGILLPEVHDSSRKVVEILAKSDLTDLSEPHSGLLLAPQTTTSLGLGRTIGTPLRPEAFESPSRFGGSAPYSQSEFGVVDAASYLHQRLFRDVQEGLKPESVSASSFQLVDTDTVNASPFGEIWGTPSTQFSSPVNQHTPASLLQERQQNGFIGQFRNASSPYTRRVSADPMSTSYKKNGGRKDQGIIASSGLPNKMVSSRMDANTQGFSFGNDPMDISGRGEGDKAVTVNGGLRWRSDETSDEEEEGHDSGRAGGKTAYTISSRGKRRSRFFAQR